MIRWEICTNRSRNFSFNSDGVGSGANLLRSGADNGVLDGKDGVNGPFATESFPCDLEDVEGPSSIYFC